MRARPTLLYPMIYLALVPLAAFITETLFLQPQALIGCPACRDRPACHGCAAYKYGGIKLVRTDYGTLWRRTNHLYRPAVHSCQLDRAGSVSKTPGTGIYCRDWFLYVRHTPDPFEPDSE